MPMGFFMTMRSFFSGQGHLQASRTAVLNAASVQSVGFEGRNPATLLPPRGGATMTATPEIRATILLVENDSALSMLLIDRLGVEGYIVHKAASAAQAIELAVQISPDLILLDLSLPDQ